MTSRLRVAQVVTRFMAGAGGVALRGALALDPERYEIAFITGEADDDLAGKARAAGHEVVLLPHLRSEIAPLDDRRALADLQACLKGFDVVHTHSSKAGAIGRQAAHRLEIGRIVMTSMKLLNDPGRHSVQSRWGRSLLRTQGDPRHRRLLKGARQSGRLGEHAAHP